MNLIDIFDGVTGGVSLYSPLFGDWNLVENRHQNVKVFNVI